MADRKKMTNQEWDGLLDDVGDAVESAGYELMPDGLLHPVGEMHEDNPDPAIEPDQIADTIGYPARLVDIWCERESKRNGWDR